MKKTVSKVARGARQSAAPSSANAKSANSAVQHPSPPHGFPSVDRGVIVRKRRRVERAKRKPRWTAKTADKYELYQLAVQSPELDVPFLQRVYKKENGRDALHFREDFCGTGWLSAKWIELGQRGATAEGFDLDPEPVAWGLARHFHELGERASNYTVHLKDVRAPGSRRYDVRVAQNFSYCALTRRDEMLEYFEAARESLDEHGVFVVDLYGGSESTEEMEEETKLAGFTYVWNQKRFFPGTGEFDTRISFRFPDGSALEDCFTYRWRMWYLTELVDLFADAGFSRVDRYFEGWNEDGTGGDGVFRKGLRGENCASWICYLAAWK